MFLSNQFDLLRFWLRDKLWLPPALASVVSVAIAAGAYLLGQKYDHAIGLEITESSLELLLSIFASSMLTVATFTLTAIVSAASSASTQTTPRASRQVLSDRTAQVVLASFIAAFIYSFVSLIALKILNYGPFGRFCLFAGFILMVTFVLVSFISWIDRALKLGRQATNIRKFADTARNSITPENVAAFGAREWDGSLPTGAAVIRPDKPGYVVSVGVENLQHFCEANGCYVTLTARPGDFIEPTTPFAYITPAAAASAEIEKAIRATVSVDTSRHEERDIRFNIVNLAETADRALSPGVNDPGTAIYVLNVMLELFLAWTEAKSSTEANEARFDRVSLPALHADELVRDAFTSISRDGAKAIEVAERLQKVLSALMRMGNPELTESARSMAQSAFEMAESALPSSAHKARLVSHAPSRT